MKFDALRTAILAALVCTAGGSTFFLLHIPLPWMLGSLTAAAIAAVLGRRWFMPATARSVARPVIGVLAGSTFSPEVAASIINWWDSILLVFAQSLVVTLLGYLYFVKVARFDRQTAYFCGTPGGLAEMSLLAATVGGNVRQVVLSQSIRVIVVLFAMPFILQIVVGHPIGRTMPPMHGDLPPTVIDWGILAVCGVVGYGIGRLVNFPAGFMIFPLILSAVAHGTELTQAAPPSWLVAGMQIVIGGVTGSRFFGIKWREMAWTVFYAVFWAFAMLAFAALTAWAGTQFIDRQFLALVLALTPGGMVEMTILTFSVGIEVAFVVTSQICRILFVLVFVPVLANALVPPAPDRHQHGR